MRMRVPTGAAAVLAGLALTASACGTSAGAQSASAGGGGGTTVVSTSHTGLGTVLTGKSGMTLYMFTSDTAQQSNCNSGCVATWPPLGKASAGSGVKASLLGTIKRDDGSVQATYHGHPLYYFTGDNEPGQTTGQGVESFYVLNPAGAVVRGKGSGGSSPSPYVKSNGGGGY